MIVKNGLNLFVMSFITSPWIAFKCYSLLYIFVTYEEFSLRASISIVSNKYCIVFLLGLFLNLRTKALRKYENVSQ